jgi:hypothetical protein
MILTQFAPGYTTMYQKSALFAGLILLSIDMACVLKLTVADGMILYIYSTHNTSQSLRQL